MSLTVSQLMELPCLRRAKVIAGHSALNRIVTCLSVLEYSMPTDTQKFLYDSIEFWGSELILTAFSNVANDVEAQCSNIKRMSEVGEVGMILYYVGLVMPRVDPKLIQLADELGFVLICMPENEAGLRYSDVIHEVMDAIIRDELNNPTFAIDLLEQMTKVPKSQQTVKTILRITSDRLRASTVIADSEFRILTAVPWPRTQSTSWDRLMDLVAHHSGADYIWEAKGEHPMWIYKAEIQPVGRNKMFLLAFSEGGKLDPMLWKQAAEGVRVSMGVWGKQHDQIDLSELVRSIIQDEPIKMRRLGDLYHIDVSSLSDMWILKSMNGESLSQWTTAIRDLSIHFTNIGLCEHYENDILIFPVGSRTLREMDEWTDALVAFCAENSIPAKITRCPALQQTPHVKYAYEVNQTYVEDALKVFPLRSAYTFSEIEFVKECREIAESGQNNVRRYSILLAPILQGRDGEDIVRTLTVFFLDKNSSITETAAHLFVHKNTVKYRLQKASDILGFHVGDVPQSKNLIYALSLNRLMKTKV